MYHSRRNQKKHDQNGFTIVELLIATMIFSLVLIVILYGVLSFTHAYYQGVNSSTTQETTRSITNTIAQAIEFSGDAITTAGTVNASANEYEFCAGGATYYYILGAEYDGATPSLNDPGLYVYPSSCTWPNAPSFSGGKEMLGKNMRITYLNLSEPSSPGSRLYNVSLSLAYGDNDLLCSVSHGSGTGGCNAGAASYPDTSGTYVTGANANDVECKQDAGYEFCAHAGLSTTVSLRVANGALGS